MKYIYLPLLFLIFLFTGITDTVISQPTVGVVAYNDTLTQEGYNLFYPHNQGNVYLIDNCGRAINVWEDTIYKPGNGYYLLENGELLKTASRGSDSNPWIHAGGGGEKVFRLDWNNNLLWEFTYNDSLVRLHHDIEPLPNGNVLMIAWERFLADDAIQAGRDTSNLPDGDLWAEKIIEVKPIGTDSFDIVWEWRVWDHLVQDFDPSKNNFGDPAENPGLIDINYDTRNGRADWLHANGIDYNPDLDQILLSVPGFHEIWIIDHSTTTAQAAGSIGGMAGQGGNLIYRWGNPQAYGAGDTDDQLLKWQHDPHWMDLGLTPSHPDYGNILIFNNQIGPDYSTVVSINPPWDMYTWSYLTEPGTFFWGPDNYAWEYQADPPQSLYSRGLSSVQRLSNGNTLICSGRQGHITEITPDGSSVWEYENPIVQGVPVSQGEVLDDNVNLLFRFARYPVNYPGFANKDLSPGDFLEMNPDSSLCPDIISSVDVPPDPASLRIYPNPATQMFYIEFDQVVDGTLMLHNWMGQEVLRKEIHWQLTRIYTNELPAGMYTISINGQHLGKILIH